MPPKRILFLINSLGTGGWERDVAMIAGISTSRDICPRCGPLTPAERTNPWCATGIMVHCLERDAAVTHFRAAHARELGEDNSTCGMRFCRRSSTTRPLPGRCHRVKAPLMYSEGTIGVSNRWRAPFFRWAIRRHCSGFTANSLSSQAFLASQGIPVEKITIIPNGHEFARFRTPLDRQTSVVAWEFPDERLIITVGRLTATKRFCDLLEAFAACTLNIPASPWPLWATARTGPSCKIRFITKNCDSSTIPGYTPRRAGIVTECRLIRVSSEMEGLPNAVIEASLARLPIVGSDIGGLREVVEDGRGATLVPDTQPAALVAQCDNYMDDEDLASRHGAAAGSGPRNCSRSRTRSNDCTVSMSKYSVPRVIQRSRCLRRWLAPHCHRSDSSAHRTVGVRGVFPIHATNAAPLVQRQFKWDRNSHSTCGVCDHRAFGDPVRTHQARHVLFHDCLDVLDLIHHRWIPGAGSAGELQRQRAVSAYSEAVDQPCRDAALVTGAPLAARSCR